MKIKALIYILFAISGFAGLIYEGIWSRYLKLLLGHASYGQILTLVIYMGGLGIGAYLFGKIVKRFSQPFLLYALLELGIGLGGIFYHQIYQSSTHLFFDWIASSQLNPFLLNGLKISLAVLTTAPWAIMLGGTFPCLVVGVMRLTQDQGRFSLPWLYFTNSLGGAMGILFTSYLFIPTYGTPGTLAMVGALNLVIAVIFMLINKRYKQTSGLPQTESTPTLSQGSDFGIRLSSSRILGVLVLTSALTGLSSFIYEIGWIRLLSLLLGSSTHSFDVMISAFILGLACGGLCARFVLGRFKEHIWVILGGIQIAMGLLAAASLLGYESLFYLVNQASDVFKQTESAYYVFGVFKYLISLLLMFPASFCAGMTLPLITWLTLQHKQQDEKWVGQIYAWNTLGAILGASIGGLYLLPLLQLKNFIIAGSLVDILLGLAIIFVSMSPLGFKLASAVASIVLLLPAFWMHLDSFALTSGVFLYRGNTKIDLEASRKHQQLTIRHGRTATVSLLEMPFKKTIATNGKIDASLYTGKTPQRLGSDDVTQAALALYPMHLMKQPYRAAVIGLGSGMTAHYLLGDPLLKSADIIEIEPEIYELAKGFLPYNQRVYESKKAKIHFEDAKTYFYNQSEPYDLIISEPSNPWVSGVSSLFSTEFYADTQRFLKPSGLLVQWMHTYEFSSDLMLSIIKSLSEHFKYIQIYGTPQITRNSDHFTSYTDVVILASNQDFDLRKADRSPELKSVSSELARFQSSASEYANGYHYLVSQPALAPILVDYKANSDFFPIVDNQAELAFYTKQHADFFNFLNYEQSAIYQSLFDPEYLANKEKFLSQNPLFTKKITELRSILKDIPPGDQDSNINTIFFERFYNLFPFINWQKSEIVKSYQQRLEQIPGTSLEKQKFALLKSLKTEPLAQQKKKVHAFLSTTEPPTVDLNLLRLLVVYTLKQEWNEEYKLLLQRFILANPHFSDLEKEYINNLPVYIEH